MSDIFPYDVFLSRCAADKAAARESAEQLRSGGIMVSFDDWEIQAGDSIPHKIENGLQLKRGLALCQSAATE